MASSSSQSCNFDVFLSFRGEDTRKTFVDHLYLALVRRLIHTYKDDETLLRGESIGPSLLKAIEGSQIAVIIFSNNYANSSWCLDELAYIMKCNNERKLTVMPVFYDVAPSDVRKQEGDFGRGFADQVRVNFHKADSWKRALFNASNISGWEPKYIANGHESKVIEDIVNAISNKLFYVNSSVDEDLVGMTPRLKELEEQLDMGSHGVRMVGIWGVGGGGKTTLAYSLYKQFCHDFQGHCYIDNIREEASKGLKNLQKRLLSTLLKTEINLQSIEEGKNIIRSRLNPSNVLVILDDVDHIDQLDALAGSCTWFGSGSRIIITTRNEQLLETHKVNVVYPIKLLSGEEAIQLFNKRAYNEEKRLKHYDALSLCVVSYAARLPLALIVLGSLLHNKDEQEWRSTIDRLRDTPPTNVLKQLKISYDGLESDEKEIFLDIACFFRSSPVDDAIETLEACGYHPRIGTRVLREKALITIVKDVHNTERFDMHDLIQEMGQHIVRGEHPNNPEKHSRLWKNEEITNMCLSDANTENDKIKAIICKNLDKNHISPFYKSVSNMKKLRLLQMDVQSLPMDGIERAEEAVFLSNELCYVDLNSYSRSMFPDTFNPVKLVVLKLSKSSQKHLWKGCKHLPHLKVLELKFMRNLLDTPDFNGLPSLQKLVLGVCTRLETIHPSLGKHTSVEGVWVQYCGKLRMFPTIIHMIKLKTLKIESGHKMFKFPEIKLNMNSLEKLSLSRIGIDALLPSIGERCANLISLEMEECFYSTSIQVSFDGLKHLDVLKINKLSYEEVPDNTFSSWLISKISYRTDPDRCDTRRLSFVPSQLLRGNLRKLQLSGLGLKDGELPTGIGEMSNLEELNLSRNYITHLGFTLSQLTRLKKFDISFTPLVEELPKLPSGLIVLRADFCTGLTITEDSFMNCKRLCDVSLTGVRVINNCWGLLKSMFQGNAIEAHCMRLRLDGIQTPFHNRGRICRVNLSENWRNNIYGFLICAVVKKHNYYFSRSVSMKEVTRGMEFEDEDGVVNWEETDDDDSITDVWYVPFASLRRTAWWNSIDKAETSISFDIGMDEDITCKDLGVIIADRKSRSGATDTSTTQQQEESEFSLYAPSYFIEDDSHYHLKIETLSFQNFRISP